MNLLDFDKKYLWHPYASAAEPPEVWEVERAEGVFITLKNGAKLIDAVSSWWCVCHGHRPQQVIEAMERQMGHFTQVMFAGFTHRPAVELAELILSRAPGNMDKVFFVDSGSVATEAMIKMAVQYQRGCNRPGRTKMLTVKKGYHGDTLGAMAVCDPAGMHEFFGGAMVQNIFADAPGGKFGEPWNDGFLGNLEQCFVEHGHEIAGFIIEPVFQGANRMNFYQPDYLKHARVLCDRYDIPLIFDEVATGFGRLGEFFAADIAMVKPDIMSVGKGITGGAAPLAAVLASEKIAGKVGKFMHGPTFMANPLCCAAGVAAQKLFDGYDWQGNVKTIEAVFRRELSKAPAFPNVVSVRTLGAVGVIELKQLPDPVRCRQIMLDCGVWLRPFGNYIYAMPPFTIEISGLAKVTEAMLEMAKL